MSATTSTRFRFAPSPNGALHLGHAYSALLNQDLAKRFDGTLLLRIEDIDTTRCTPQLEDAMLADLRWLGLTFDPPHRRQSDHFNDYREALDTLKDAELIYPAFMSRKESRAFTENNEQTGEPWPRDPDGAPHYPSLERSWSSAQRKAQIEIQPRHAWRLDMQAALKHIGGTQNLDWLEFSEDDNGQDQIVPARPEAWGDVVLARSDTPTSYHLSVAVDDTLQGITHVVRGRDLLEATAVHRVLQELLGYPQPCYHHHSLIVAEDGRKLSKSVKDTGLAELRTAGLGVEDIRRMVGLR